MSPNDLDWLQRIPIIRRLTSGSVDMSELTPAERNWVITKMASLGGERLDVKRLTDAELEIMCKIKLPGE